MRYSNTSKINREHPVWMALTHFFNHQTHHRGQGTTLLSQAGVDPGLTDLIALISWRSWQRWRPAWGRWRAWRLPLWLAPWLPSFQP